MKKAQGLPLNTIIIAIIALIVLVVIIAIFSNSIGGFGSGTKDCVALGGVCSYSNVCRSDSRLSDGEYVAFPTGECDDSFRDTCCKLVYKD